MSSIKAVVGMLGGFGFILMLIFAVLFVMGAVLWPYTINTWLVYSGKEPAIEWWMGGLMAMVPGFGQTCIPAAIITFIIMLFIGG